MEMLFELLLLTVASGLGQKDPGKAKPTDKKEDTSAYDYREIMD